MKAIRHVTIVTMGCSKNLVDSEQLLRQFEAIGYAVGHDSDVPSGGIVIINTCGFIGDAKEESIDTILEYAAARKKGRISKLYVMGCLSERYLSELGKEIPEVDHFYGKFNWKEVLSDLGEVYRDDLRLERRLTTPSHYAYVKISEGCSRTCSYCAIPIITGKHVSRPMEDILEEVRMLVSTGVKEVQLIAQDLSYYGRDNYKTLKLPELVERIAQIPGLEWLRLHYTYPYEFPMDLLRVMHENPNVCAYLDMALQHISDPMLIQMRRKINKDETLALLKQIRREVPGIHLRTTLMVGHPGETEEDFKQLCDFVKEQRFERMGAFIYSDEEGTYAARHYEDSIPEDVKRARLDELMLIQQSISSEFNNTKIGQDMKVIIDREEPDFFVGRTEFDSPDVDPEVFVTKENPLEIGSYYLVKINSAGPYDLFGSVKAVL
ncbi:MAG TPA: 30S ribosomal protein S12 methylthiotransferase RimO [Bacteroidales bacterium]|nr:30S ribosomal protein S12 methylthiotransferase RimO [Bacteroidales bacterium]